MKKFLTVLFLTTLTAPVIAGDSPYTKAVKLLADNEAKNNRMVERQRHLLRAVDPSFSLRSKSKVCGDMKKQVSDLANDMNQLTDLTLKEIVNLKNSASQKDLTTVAKTQDLILLDDLASTLSGNLSVFTFSMEEEELEKFYQACLTKAQEPMKESLTKISDRLQFQSELFKNAKDQSLLKL
jgi:hypothetical protein